MPESVSHTHEGVTITTNTASADALAAEMMTTPEIAPETPPSTTRARDDKGRYIKADGTPEAAPPAPESTAPEATPQTTAQPQRDPSLPKHDPVARMKQALAQKAEAERRASALEAELQKLRSGVTSPVIPQTPSAPTPQPNGNGHAPAAPAGAEPQFEQFLDTADPYTAYVQAWTRWDRAQALAEARREWETEQSAKTRAKTFEARLAEGRQQYGDFDQVLEEADTLGLQVSAVMQEAIVDSPRAADLVHYLATHPEECIQLAEESRATPVAAATVMRRLLESHLVPRPAPTAGTGTGARAQVSTAKPPVTPVGSSPVVSDDPPGDAASAAEHARYWNRRLKVPGTR